MNTTTFQLMARVDQGGPMHRRRHRRMRNLNQNIEQKRTRFEVHLRREGHKQGQEAMMPPATETKTEKTEQPARPSSDAMRKAYRRGYMHGFKHMRQLDPHAPQGNMGWVTSRLSRMLTDNPFMAEAEIESVVESLVAGMPSYEGQE